MSLIRMAMRMTAVAALRNRTWAEERVYNSDNTPLAQAIGEDDPPKPYIVIFTDADNRTDISGTEIYDCTRQISLVLEIAVASKVVGEQGQYQIHLPQTDAGMETAIDIVEDQAIGAVIGDPRSQWGELMRLFVCNVIRMPSTRGAQAQRGARWAARQLTMVCDILPDMPPGVPYPEDHPVRKFIELAREDPSVGMMDAADLVEKLMDRPVSPSWEQDQAWLGLTKRGIRATGFAPLAEIPIGSTPLPVQWAPDVTDEAREGPDLFKITVEQETDGASSVPGDLDIALEPEPELFPELALRK
jgi:hypothetical protein